MQFSKILSLTLVLASTSALAAPIPGSNELLSNPALEARSVQGSEGLMFKRADWNDIIAGAPLNAQTVPVKASASNRLANAAVKGGFKIVNGIKKLFGREAEMVNESA